MRLLRLHLHAFGPFTGRQLDFGTSGRGLVLIHGANEAGKSATLRAIADLRFGIPLQSPDNFIHAHPDMRIGAVMLDAKDQPIGLVRRKGRGQTLSRRDPDSLALDDLPPADSGIEAQLTAGLSRADYETLFSLDHTRLREGGKALLEGKGDVGAALFEASAGVRSVQAVLKRLDDAARQFFVPGTRGRHGRINELLRQHDEAHKAYRDHLLRPAHWLDLSRRHEAAAETLAAIEAEERSHRMNLALIRELRAVAPMLRDWDAAQSAIADLGESRLLPPDASTRRQTIEARLAEARLGAARDEQAGQAQRDRLSRLPDDSPLLEQATAIDRLQAASERLDQQLTELADAKAQLTRLATQRAELLARLGGTQDEDRVLARRPSAAIRVGIEDSLRQVEADRMEMNTVRQSLARLEEEETALAQADADVNPAPAAIPEARLALRAARAEVARHETWLRQSEALPARIEQATRELHSALSQLGLADESALAGARPLLDADIDGMLSQRDQLATQRQGLTIRIEQIDQALAQESRQQEALLSAGEVPTQAQLGAAREERNRLWRAIRDGVPDDSRSLLAIGLDAALAHTDQLADALARDTERAARLQASRARLAMLGTDRAGLSAELANLREAGDALQAQWQDRLQSAGLPRLTPEALREWQGKLSRATALAEGLSQLRQEHAQTQSLAQTLVHSLRHTILATGRQPLTEPGTVAALARQADEIEQAMLDEQNRQAGSAGQRQQRARERRRLQGREQTLREQTQASRQTLDQALADLGLPAGSPEAMARAHLSELDRLAELRDESLRWQSTASRARGGLQQLADQTRAVLQALGESAAGIDTEAGADVAALRLRIEALARRLADARRIQGERQLVLQALQAATASLETQRQTIVELNDALAALCAQAGVDDASLLPALEERSSRLRAAQDQSARSVAQLAQATPRSREELRERLRDREPAVLEADEARETQALAAIDARLRAARAEEESARHALDQLDGGSQAAAARESMEIAAAGIRGAMAPWVRSRLAHALLAEATRRFRDRAQGPMLAAASGYFQRMTDGEYSRLLSDDSDGQPVLLAQRRDGGRLGSPAMSEGTRDQLFLALRLAALTIRRAAGIDLPLILDDVLMTSDDARAARMLDALADHAQGGQVFVFTHHQHLLEVARQHLPASRLTTLSL